MSSFNQPFKLIAVDCDGTLFNRDSLPSQRTCEMVKRLVDAGHHIVAATGRSQRTACHRLSRLPGMRYAVCSNGAYTWDMHDDKLVWESVLDQLQVADIALKVRHAFPDTAFGWETRRGIKYEGAFVELAGGIGELESGGENGDPWRQDLYKLYVRRPGIDPLELQSEIVALLGNNQCEISTSGAPFLEITAKGVDKASGLEKTAAILGFTAADTIVFGDNHNDLPMFEWAGRSVAMGNAVDAVLAKADAVTLRNTEHGVAHYLDGMFESGLL